MSPFHAKDLEALFSASLGAVWNTVLRGGAEEPFYAPASGRHPAVVHYTRDYFRSALHEVAHWCIAGKRRRQLPDFGYWYAPDGRDADTQAAFLWVEEKPQALEWLFCAACGHSFCVSLDNLSGEPGEAAPFEQAVRRRAVNWLNDGTLPPRAGQWVQVLATHYGRTGGLDENALNAVFRPL